jgi:hypothetical protein
MRRYYHLPLLEERKAYNVSDIAYVAFLSLEECGLVPQKQTDVTEHIYDILKGEAWDYISVYRLDLVRLLKDWESMRIQFREEARILREKQDEEYTNAISLDKKENFVLRYRGERTCVNAHSSEAVSVLLQNISVAKASSYVFTSYDERIVVNDCDLSLSHYGLKKETVYNVEDEEETV